MLLEDYGKSNLIDFCEKGIKRNNRWHMLFNRNWIFDACSTPVEKDDWLLDFCNVIQEKQSNRLSLKINDELLRVSAEFKAMYGRSGLLFS